MDERIDIPQDLSGLSVDELTALGLQIRERVEGLADEARDSDDAIAEVEGLISSFDEIDKELQTRQQAAAERAARLDAAMSRFGGDAEETAEDTEAAETEETEAASVEVEEAAAEEEDDDEKTAAAAADETVEAATETEAVEEAATEEVAETAVEEDAVAEAAVESAETTEATTESADEFAADEADTAELATEEAAEAAASPEEGTTTMANKSVAGLSDHRPESAAPVPVPAGASFRANGIGGKFADGQNIDMLELATAIVESQRSYKGHAGPRQEVKLGVAVAEFDTTVGGSIEDNFVAIDDLVRAHRDGREADNAIVASGGVCAPLQQDYDFFRLAEEMNPVERALPVAAAPRGGIRYIQPPDFRDAAPGVRITTEEEDAAGYESQGGPTPDKPCVAVTCPPIQECRVDAVSRCVTFGNLNYRVFPEQVQAFLADLSVIFTETKEIFYLDAIDAASTPVTSIQTYSAVRTLIYDLLAASANYRRRHHMRPEATLDVLLPSWLPELMKVDMVNDHALGLNFIDADMARINSFFAKANLSVAWYYDSATGAGQAFNGPQGVGDLNSFPTTTVSYMFAPGTFVRLDAGTLDVGLVRDSILNGTNDLQLFAEQWIQVCMVGLESLRIEHTLCPDGTAPEPVTPLTCPTGDS